ncbi:uncharacterized protein LOC135366368 [Ornithodoros turicata]|uniref:uncharacterized protein LOC135366368 n=1 Tax=Ornithodoros turicata TaxID=34597 RepID=UPI0031392CC0
MAREDPSRWHDSLPLVLLGIRSAWKEDLGCAAAELVYGTTLRLPAQFFDSPSQVPVDPSVYLSRLREQFSRMRPTPTRAQQPGTTFVSPHLRSASKVFVRTDAVRKSLQPPYSGPYTVLKHGPKHFTIDFNGRPDTVSIERLKPAFTEADVSASSFTFEDYE